MNPPFNFDLLKTLNAMDDLYSVEFFTSTATYASAISRAFWLAYAEIRESRDHCPGCPFEAAKTEPDPGERVGGGMPRLMHTSYRCHVPNCINCPPLEVYLDKILPEHGYTQDLLDSIYLDCNRNPND